ncbi:hypothetical protein QZH41_008957 [Actinostola sp. cb2023]|nr:hypothetical protein QZH41_008957 [Actinostola sp. cb2023]
MVDLDDSYLRDHKRTVRARASESLDSLRTALDSPVGSPPTARDSYTEAVSRLKLLLQQYNDHQHLGPSFSPLPTNHPLSIPGHLPDPDELRELIDHYYSVIQHLQAQVDLLKDALVSLKQKTKLLCEENQCLLEQLKDSTVNQLLNHHKENKDQRSRHNRNSRDYSDTDEAAPSNPRKRFSSKSGDDQEWFAMDDSTRTQGNTSDIDDQLFLSPKERKFVMKMEEEVDKIRHLHEAKAKQLESLLFSARDEIEEHQRHIAKLQEQLRYSGVLSTDLPGQPVLCVKCGQQEAVLSSTHGDALTRTLEKLKRERDDLMETLTSQNSSISKIRQREIDAYNQVKKSCELAEQAQLEKAEVRHRYVIVRHRYVIGVPSVCPRYVIGMTSVREDTTTKKERYDKFVSSAQEHAAKENESLISEYQKQMEALKNKIQDVTDERVATENQVERLTREKVSLYLHNLHRLE